MPEALPNADPIEGLGFDPEPLAAKHRDERSKRLREDGIHQYREAKGALQQFADDPHVERLDRKPVDDDCEILIIGGGFGGLVVAAHLQEAGISNIRIVEKAGDFGGVWYWNRYTGAQCDTESYIYMPLLEEMGYMASKKYARQPEILEHARSIGQKLDLYSKTLFQTEVLDLDWINDSSCWSIRTSRGDTIRAQFVVSAIGLLHKLHLPGIQGIEIFKGYSFHSSRWDYDYTGGDFNGNLFKLSDKKVGIIGTGASCVQILPHLSTSAKHVYIFQRTPSAVDGQKNPSTDPNFAKGPASKPGWQTRRMANFDSIVSGSQEEKDMVADGWTEVYTKTTPFQPSKDTAEGAAIAKHMQLADFQKMEEIRARTDAIVKDPKTAGKKGPGGRKALGEERPWGRRPWREKNHGREPTMQADATAILVFSLSLSTFALSIHKPLLAREYR